MRLTATTSLLLLALAVLCAGSALAGPPAVGTYTSLAGTILPGRASESHPCDGCDGQIGNLLMVESWSGAALGTEWKVSCGAISAAPVLLLDTVVNGTGQRIYRTSYGGASLWLSGAAAWAGGDAAYTSSALSLVTVATVQIVNGSVVGVVSNTNLSGDLDGYGDCFTLAISNAAMVGATPGVAPGVWPAFRGPSDCGLDGTHGAWWNVTDVTLSLLGDCATPTVPSTWGTLKTLYR